jgi:hypothetical protein
MTIFNRLLSVPESHTSARWLWELYAIWVGLLNQEHTISLRQLFPTTPPSKPPRKKIRVTSDSIRLPFSRVIVHGDKEALCKEISRIIPSLSPSKATLFVPGARNQVTFDAFSISDDNEVTLYQATIRKDDSVKAKGLECSYIGSPTCRGTNAVVTQEVAPSFPYSRAI